MAFTASASLELQLFKGRSVSTWSLPGCTGSFINGETFISQSLLTEVGILPKQVAWRALPKQEGL